MSDLDKKITAFGKEILEMPEFADFRQALKKLENTPAAIKILQNVQERVQTINTLRQNGLAITMEQREELEKAQAALRNSEICLKFMRSQNVATRAAQKVCNELTSITGVPFAGGGGGCCG